MADKTEEERFEERMNWKEGDIEIVSGPDKDKPQGKDAKPPARRPAKPRN